MAPRSLQVLVLFCGYSFTNTHSHAQTHTNSLSHMHIYAQITGAHCSFWILWPILRESSRKRLEQSESEEKGTCLNPSHRLRQIWIMWPFGICEKPHAPGVGLNVTPTPQPTPPHTHTHTHRFTGTAQHTLLLTETHTCAYAVEVRLIFSAGFLVSEAKCCYVDWLRWDFWLSTISFERRNWVCFIF